MSKKKTALIISSKSCFIDGLTLTRFSLDLSIIFMSSFLIVFLIPSFNSSISGIVLKEIKELF